MREESNVVHNLLVFGRSGVVHEVTHLLERLLVSLIVSVKGWGRGKIYPWVCHDQTNEVEEQKPNSIKIQSMFSVITMYVYKLVLCPSEQNASTIEESLPWYGAVANTWCKIEIEI